VSSVVGVVLGAGESSRFGTPKQLLPFGGTTLLGQAVRNANASALDRVVVVLGRASQELRASVDFGRAEVVENTAYGTGCASSLLAGLDAAGEDCEAIALLLGDQPGVRPEFIDYIVATWRRERPWAAVTSYVGGLGHPFVFTREAFGELRGLHGDKAVWKLIEAYPERVSRVRIEAPLPPDVDTPEDYGLALAHWRSGISAIVLAAGAGSRFGGGKLLAPFGGRTLVETTLLGLREAPVDETIVVVGNDAEGLRGLCESYGVRLAENPDWAEGMATSLKKGLASCSPDASAAVVVLADQPLVGAKAVERLVGAYDGGASMAVATYGGERRNPALFARGMWSMLEKELSGDEGARGFLGRHPEMVTEVPCDDVADPTDVDTVEDLRRLQARLR
jgi:CTP:molybdopterin cytidylyltransferase MocA